VVGKRDEMGKAKLSKDGKLREWEREGGSSGSRFSGNIRIRDRALSCGWNIRCNKPL
jgi:hypothetical protein